MLQYLIILLDDTSTSYCHYGNERAGRRLIALEDLKAGIFFAMKENLMIQFVYPDYELPQAYKDAIQSIDHSDFVSSTCEDASLRRQADVVVYHGFSALRDKQPEAGTTCVLRTTKAELFQQYAALKDLLPRLTRLNVVITDVETFTGADFETYRDVLTALAAVVEQCYVDRKSPQLNLLTDRMMLERMNNCNAGVENITFAPDGRFYICPAFYLAGDEEDYGLGKAKFSIGDLEHGLDVKSPQLYRLDHAPLCHRCDAYQCKRCVWLNRKTTYEVNTPGHEQCVVAHLERNASRSLLANIRRHGTFLPGHEIEEIDYLDPFDVKDRWERD